MKEANWSNRDLEIYTVLFLATLLSVILLCKSLVANVSLSLFGSYPLWPICAPSGNPFRQFLPPTLDMLYCLKTCHCPLFFSSVWHFWMDGEKILLFTFIFWEHQSQSTRQQSRSTRSAVCCHTQSLFYTFKPNTCTAINQKHETPKLIKH